MQRDLRKVSGRSGDIHETERFMWRFGGDTGRLGGVKKRRCREIREFYSRYYIEESQGDIYRDLEEIQRDLEEVQQDAKRFIIHGRLGRFGGATGRLGEIREI
jgi:hypothetical protein